MNARLTDAVGQVSAFFLSCISKTVLCYAYEILQQNRYRQFEKK
jgi:hypothetical protein